MRRLLERLRAGDPAEGLLVTFAFVFPLFVLPHPIAFSGGRLDYFYAPRFVLLALFSFAAAFLLFRRGVRVYPGKSPALWLLLVFFTFGVVATSMAPYPSLAFWGANFRYTGLATYLLSFPLFLLAALVGRNASAVKALVLAGATASVLALAQLLGLSPVPHEPYRSGMTAYATLGSAENLGAFLGFAFPASLWVALTSERRRGLWVGAALFVWVGLLVTLDWPAWTGALFGTAVVLRDPEVRRLPRKSLVAYASAFASATLAFLAGLWFTPLAQVVGWLPPSEFWSVWGKVLRLCRACWAWGLGPDHLTVVVRQMPWLGFWDKTPSMYLETLVTMGAFAAVTYFAWIVAALRHAKGELVALGVSYLVTGLYHSEILPLLPLFWVVLGFASASKGIVSVRSTVVESEGGDPPVRIEVVS
ncbi:hypothetical protein [Brockia lithotrophica]|uniref:Uncharacterized protein n=1 Tax=Brockia lithotrophica TaxID=933949 RepID=A0A660L711_9BACL|nr:hypothetical protein [Brockia lithotrophica]RKQ88622.1 hypothetical protein C7438_0261 [Brockia lithotrophica]